MSYCILFFPVWLLSLKGLMFSKEEMEAVVDQMKRVVEGELGGLGGRGNCGQMHCMREESICSEKIKIKKILAGL